jgi:hypothetical protein
MLGAPFQGAGKGVARTQGRAAAPGDPGLEVGLPFQGKENDRRGRRSPTISMAVSGGGGWGYIILMA